LVHHVAASCQLAGLFGKLQTCRHRPAKTGRLRSLVTLTRSAAGWYNRAARIAYRRNAMQEAVRDPALAALDRVKAKPDPAAHVPVFQYGRPIARLEPITNHDLNCVESLATLARWRTPQADAATVREEARLWLGREVLDAPDRVAFWVKGPDGTPVGCLGLANLDLPAGRVEIRPLLRGVPGVLPGVMYAGVQALLAWTFQHFPVRTVFIHVPANAERALRLCERSGFRGEPAPAGQTSCLTLSLKRSDWMAGHRLEKAPGEPGGSPEEAASPVRQNAAA
jgi:RimJ/RimL family protein N-acetyltransferase